jgi:probable rRNA maturation factor
LPDFIESPLLGDLVICHAVVSQEALDQDKAINAHYQHLIVHGVLHLLGFDHIEEADAEVMEAHEITLLDKLGIDDPYQVD